MISGLVKKTPEALLLLLSVFVAFMFRYWHLASTGWIEGNSSFLLGMHTENGSPFHFSDSDYYHNLALNYLNGGGLNLPFPPPFTEFFLIVSYTLFGVDFFSVKLVYAVLGSLSLIPVYFIAKLSLGRAEATVTVILSALSFNLIFITGGLNIENLYLFTLSVPLFLFAIIYTVDKMKTRGVLFLAPIFGFSSAVAALTRSEFILVFLILNLFILFKKGFTRGKRAKILLLTGLVFSLSLLPWGYRNYYYMKNFNSLYPEAGLPLFVPTSLNGPLNFYQGHNPDANGTYTPGFLGHLADGYHASVDFTNREHLSYMADGYKLGFKYIFNNPLRELVLLPVKFHIFLDGLTNGFFLNNFPAGLAGQVFTMADSFVPASGGLAPVGLILFFTGLISVARSRRLPSIKYLPLILLLIVLVINLAFYGLSRLVYPMLPYYFMMVSAGMVALLRISGVLKRVRPVHAAVLLVAALLVGYIQSRGFIVLEKMPDRDSTGYSLKVKEITGRGIL